MLNFTYVGKVIRATPFLTSPWPARGPSVLLGGLAESSAGYYQCRRPAERGASNLWPMHRAFAFLFDHIWYRGGTAGCHSVDLFRGE